MAVRHPTSRAAPWPSVWLMTDERMGEGLWRALEALPRGSGVVFRHFATGTQEREALLARIVRVAQRRHLLLLRASPSRQPGRVPRSTVVRDCRPGKARPGGCRDKPGMTKAPMLAAAHSVGEGLAARRSGATLILVSPIHPTRTHPGAPSLGPLRAAMLARAVGLPAIALGGMTRARFARLKALGFVGWAAIDGLTPA